VTSWSHVTARYQSPQCYDQSMPISLILASMPMKDWYWCSQELHAYCPSWIIIHAHHCGAGLLYVMVLISCLHILDVCHMGKVHSNWNIQRGCTHVCRLRTANKPWSLMYVAPYTRLIAHLTFLVGYWYSCGVGLAKCKYCVYTDDHIWRYYDMPRPRMYVTLATLRS